MTAEVAIMNARGVAIAGESATKSGKTGKCYYSNEKVFQLSENHAIGLLLCGTPAYLDMRIDYLIHLFGKKVKDTAFETVMQCGEEFISFLSETKFIDVDPEYFEAKVISRNIQKEISDLYNVLREMKDDIFYELKEKNLLDDLEAKYIEKGKAHLSYVLDDIKKRKYIDGFNDKDFKILVEKKGSYIEGLIKEEYGHYIFNEEFLEYLIQIPCLILLKHFCVNRCNVVFAGYGEKEIYPSIVTYTIESTINGKIKYELTENKTKKYSDSNGAQIIPFAMERVVNTFVSGIDNKFENHLKTHLKFMTDAFIHNVEERLEEEKIDAPNWESIKEIMQKEFKDFRKGFHSVVNEYKENNHIIPTKDIIISLPPKELGEMAERLIQLSAFSKLQRMDVEVGGPVDVAVITKEGFHWVKKKNLY